MPVSRSQAVGTVGPHLPIKLVPGIYVLGVSLITIRSSVSPPSTSDNKPRIAYMWMYVSWDRYRDTYLDIWVRRVIIIIISSVIVIVIHLLLCLLFHVIVPVMTQVILWLLSFLWWFQWWIRLDLLLVPIRMTVRIFCMYSCHTYYLLRHWIYVALVMHFRLIIVCFATLILYAWDCCGMRQGYIYEGFLVWIIPSTY